MRNLLTAATMFLLCQNLFASASWPNEPAGSTPLFDCGFDQEFIQDSRVPTYFTTCDGKLHDPYGTITRSLNRVQDVTAPLSPANVLRSTRFANNPSGGTQLGYNLPTGTNEIYMGLWWRTNPEFMGKGHAGNKLFFIRGINTNNGVFLFNWRTGSTSTGFLKFGPQWFQNADQCADSGLNCLPNINNVPVMPGIWYRIEVYMKASTCNTCHDGILRWWITPKGGVPTLAANYEKFAYGPTVDNWTWSETWDGSGPASEWPTEANHFIDHLYVSYPNCGAGGCPAPAYLVITSSLNPGRTGTPYSATLTANGGTKPYTWFLDSGNLPAGLSLNKGVITGTPTCVGRSNFTLRVTDASSPALSTTKSYSIITSGTGAPCISEPSAIIGTEAKMSRTQFSVKAVRGELTFNLPVTSSAQYRLSIFDLTGKKMYERSSKDQKEISIPKTLKNGVYLAKFVQGSVTSALRFQVMN